MNNCGKNLKKKIRNRRFLRNKRSFIFIAVLFMGIGFAYLSSNLTITGNTSVSGNSWNIYFTNVQVTEDSVEASIVPTTSGTNTTSIDYTVTLDKPGDFYEFTVDAVNDGTIDAMVESINMTSLDSDVAKYLTYTATYLNDTPLAQYDILEANGSVTYKVRVDYKKNILADDLNENGVNLNLTFEINYKQNSYENILRRKYGESINTLYSELYYQSKDVQKTVINSAKFSADKNYSGNFQYPVILDNNFPKNNRLNFDSRTTSSSCNVQDVYSGTNNYNFIKESLKNSWISIRFIGGNFTQNIRIGDIKLKFKDQKSYTIQEAVENKYIEPLVVVSSTSDEIWYLNNVLNTLNGGRTDTQSWSNLYLFFKVKDVEMNAIEFYSSVNFYTANYCDGLDIFQAPANFDITIK